MPHHSHTWDQLIYASRGVMTVRTPHGTWVVPPDRAVWVPAECNHSIEMSGAVAMRTAYFRPGVSQSLPAECCVVNVSPLLRELLLHAIKIGMLRSDQASDARLLGVLLDQLATLPVMPLQLPMPEDARAMKVVELLRENREGEVSLDRITKQVGASKRTIERLFVAGTGMAFGRWRQRNRLFQALRLLASGAPVTSVAYDVGYASVSAFVSAFRREFGVTPARYYAPPNRQAKSSASGRTA